MEKHYTYEDDFTASQGLMIAAGMSLSVPLAVGKLEIYVTEWDTSDPQYPKYRNEPLPTHSCTESELGLTKNDNG